MKQLLVVLFMFMPLVSMAQNFNGDGSKYEAYCEVRIYKSLVYIVIDNKHYNIVDKEGKQVKVSEATEALNLLSKRGWKLVTAWGVDLNSYERYTMKKEITDDKEKEIGLVLKK